MTAGTVNTLRAHAPLTTCVDACGMGIDNKALSNLPGERAVPIGPCAIDDLLRDLYAQWIRGGRQPLLLEAAAVAALRKPCSCSLHGAFPGMRSLLVDGVRDRRSGRDSLYIALVWRRLAAFRLDDLPAADAIAAPHALDLSAREHEILGTLSRGSTNSDIAEALEISLFTVKNHLKRIFRKIGVSNRTQAAARYNVMTAPQKA